MSEELLLSPSQDKARGSVNRSLLAPQGSPRNSASGGGGSFTDNRGKRVLEGFLQNWSFAKKRFENWYVILWENKAMTLYAGTKPYNDRSAFKMLIQLNPMIGYLFFMTTPEAPHCFQLVQEEKVIRLAGESADREKFATVMLNMGIRMVTGPGAQESMAFVNLMKTLPQLTSEITKLSRLPTMMQVLCVECDQSSALLRCDQCDDLYCQSCFDSLHKSGKRTTHTVQYLEAKKQNTQEKTLVELYKEKLPFVIAEIVEHISTVEEVESFKYEKPSPKAKDASPDHTRTSVQMDAMEGVVDTGDPRRGLGRAVATRALHHHSDKKKKKDETWLKVSPLGIKLTDEEEKEFHDNRVETLREAENAFAQLVSQFRECCEIKDRSYLFTKYPNCFVGKQTVDSLVRNNIVSSRSDAVALGNRLLDEEVIQHVAKEHAFEDAGLFYRFVDSPLPRASEQVTARSPESEVSLTAPPLFRTPGSRDSREVKETEPEKEKEKEIFAVGDYVELFGLEMKEFNGQRGHVAELLDNSRCDVRLESGTLAKFRMMNMSKVAGP